jgi:hypothetical protein
LVESACASLTEPSVDVEAVDRGVESLLQDSRLGRATTTTAARVATAWTESRTRAIVRLVAGR